MWAGHVRGQAPMTALYGCFAGAHGYFGATDATCNGQTLEGVLGYVLTKR